MLNGEAGFERGLTLGRMTRDVCVHNLMFLEQKLVAEGLTLNYGISLALENEKVMAEHFPELLDEIRGLAQGAQLPYKHVLLETAFPFIASASIGCTVIFASGTLTTDGMPLVGRNYDFLSDFKECNQLRIVRTRSKKFSFVGGTVTILGVEEGLNNAGLFVGDAGWEPKLLPSSRGLSSMQVMQLVLENCDSVDAAVDLIRHTPKFANHAGSCYLLADKKEAVIMEMGLMKSCLRELEEGMLVASNVFLTPIAAEMKPSDSTAFIRHDYARRYLRENRGKLDAKSMRELLSEHSVQICSHNEINTLRSVIGRPNERKMLVADGHSCSSRFEEISVPI